MSYSMGSTIYMYDTRTVRIKRSEGGYDLIAENEEGNCVYLYCFGEDVILSADLIDNKEEEEVSEPA